MLRRREGFEHVPKGKYAPVCSKGEFLVGVIGLEHGHIYAMCTGLKEAGATISMVWDLDPLKVETFRTRFPEAVPVRHEEEILESEAIRLVVSAAIPDQRGVIGVKAMLCGKDYFCDKPPFVSLQDLTEARKVAERTGRKFAVYYSERIHVEAAVYAEELIAQGAIGRVIHVMGWGPHRLSPDRRPAWFFDKKRYGGILVDLGCHQIDQILYFAGAGDGSVVSSRVANYYHKDYPNFEDFGDAMINCDNGVAGYFRVDWFTPDGLSSWGDGRVVIVGTDGYIELRKYLDVASDPEGDHVILVNHEGEYHFKVAGRYGYPFFGKFIRDCLEGTENAFSQRHVFRVAELALIAQERAIRLDNHF